MPTLDIFNDDAFSVSSLTAAINETDYVPGRLGEIGLFDEEGITTTTAQVEKRGEALELVSAADRGQSGQIVAGTKREMIPFNAIHLPERATILADEVQNMRAFGQESEVEMVQNVVNQRLAKMRRQLDATLEFHRIGAITGKILDADGTTVLLNLFTAFGITQQTVNCALTTDTTRVRSKIVDAKRKAEKALGASRVTSWRVLCGSSFFDNLINHPDVKAAYERWEQGAALRDDMRGGFPFAGVVFEEYRGSVGGTDFVAAGEAYLVPEGVPDLFITRFAPADYVETVGTMGLPVYAKQELMQFGKGIDMESQSNPINLCTRPKAVIKLTES